MRAALARAVVEGDGPASAEAVDLHYVSTAEPGLTRVRRGKALSYRDPAGRTVRDPATLARIRALAIPPAWTDVWIATDPDGHLQATGLDARGRKQYRYHPRWRQVRDAAKYHRLGEFCRALPKLRRAVERDLACACLCKPKVIATVVALLERGALRVGNDEYVKQNGSYGATTLRNHHARIEGGALVLAFRAKSGVERRVRVSDRRLAKIVRRCKELPGQRLFQYVNGGGQPQPIGSADVNDYIRAATGGPFTAKDYRTWAATMGAALLLRDLEPPHRARDLRRTINQTLERVAERLGHTATVCRASYIHPAVLDGFGSGALAAAIPRRPRLVGDDPLGADALRSVEAAVARFLAAPAAGLRGAGGRAITRSCPTTRKPTRRRSATIASGARRATAHPTAG